MVFRRKKESKFKKVDFEGVPETESSEGLTKDEIEQQMKELEEKVKKLKQEEDHEQIPYEEREEQIVREQPKKRIIVVKEIPTMPVRRYKDKDGTLIQYVTVEEYLTQHANSTFE